MYGGVPFAPVNVISGTWPPSQMVAAPVIVAIGNGLTVIVAEPDAEFVQFASLTDTRL